MKEIKHSEGPFMAGVGRSLGLNIIGVFSSPSKVVAICGEQGANDEGESAGNSYLFAASLDMYEALKDAMKWFSKLDDWSGVGDPAIEMYRAAIAKAEGRPA